MGIVENGCVIGVDGGGTGCRAGLATLDGSVLATAKAGPANFSTDPDQARANVMAAITCAAESVGLLPAQLRCCAIHLGLAGIMQEADAARFRAVLPFTRAVVTDDRPTSFAGALGQGDGVLAAVGTGTLVAARFAQTHRYFCGWGFDLSDQASGAWLGRGALMRCLLAHDGLAAQSPLTRAIMAQFGDVPTTLVDFASAALPADYATFAPQIVEAAKVGDETASDLMRQGAAYLNSCFAAASAGQSGPFCLSGGIGPHYAPYLETRFRDRLVAPLGTALDGALFLARQAHQNMETLRLAKE
ncbi:N-acetylglucosamine kinase (plasmid) [Pseudorhodobacter turbinis]|uniref:N-acetylglucosamine kinase n=1 Tax=Pseudorhodobacter turbinis TaxID=2500533 RepID=A0A4P8ELI4_9RHOB|nr:BadF/BadG/BcrA/BcrD ATPase family protein [Pseudorhodobacter turbinis]QCO57859.1 N-acetylglucosamine kinase [Pseudorhodobacter turbinis]